MRLTQLALAARIPLAAEVCVLDPSEQISTGCLVYDHTAASSSVVVPKAHIQPARVLEKCRLSINIHMLLTFNFSPDSDLILSASSMQRKLGC